MIDRLEAIAKRYREIEAEMARPEVATNHERFRKGGRPPLRGTPHKLQSNVPRPVRCGCPAKPGNAGRRQ